MRGCSRGSSFIMPGVALPSRVNEICNHFPNIGFHFPLRIQLRLLTLNNEQQRTKVKIKTLQTRNFWGEKKNHRLYLDEVATHLNITHYTDWYNFKVQDIRKFTGSSTLLQLYNGSLIKALRENYNEHPWCIFHFRNLPRHYWNNKSNHKEFLRYLEREMNIQHQFEWFKVTKQQVIDHGGIVLLSKYGSLYNALLSLYPHIEWNPFLHLPYSSSSSSSDIAFPSSKMGVSFDVRTSHHHHHSNDNNGGGKREGSGNDKSDLEERRKEKDIVRMPRPFWKSETNQRRFLETFKRLYAIEKMEDWYAITIPKFIEAGGLPLIKRYKNMFLLLSHFYPTISWDIFRFKNYKGKLEYFDSRSYILKLMNEFRIERSRDWYRISVHQLRTSYEGEAVFHSGGLFALLASQFPEYGWCKKEFLSRHKKAAQRELLIEVERLLTHQLVIEDYLHPHIKFERSNLNAQLDVFVPSFNLALEYHGEQHYDENIAGFSPVGLYSAKDTEKQTLTDVYGLKLIVVPYWFGRQFLSLFVSQQIVSKLFNSGE